MSWLELFFDLVFVVVIARLAHHLVGHLDVKGVATFAAQFLAVFWVWNAFTYYTERFESDGLENRLLAFLAIVPVAGLAVFAEEGLGATYIGFAVAYLLARAVNQIGWIRAGLHVPVFRPVAARFVGGTVAVVLDIATPYFTVAQRNAAG